MIYGKRVRLRAPEPEDLPTFVVWFNDPEVRKTLRVFEPMSLIREQQWFENFLAAHDKFLFVVETNTTSSPEMIGVTGLEGVHWRYRLAEFGLTIGEKDQWNQGYGQEITHLMMEFAFHQLNLQRVELEVFSNNPYAKRCYEKVGFKVEGTRRKAIPFEGTYIDSHWMGLLRDEWEQSRSGTP
jgi:RimJ/RimL family protein N-acetyltransferase